METIEKKPISFAELRNELKNIKKRDGQLSFRATKTEEYLDLFTKISGKEASEMQEEISKLNIARLKDIHIVKLIDTMPKSVPEAKLVLQGYSVTVKNEELKKLVDIIAKRLPQKK